MTFDILKRPMHAAHRAFKVRYIVLAILLLVVNSGKAQEVDLKKLIETEKAFAANSKATNTKQAFLNYLSDSGVVFKNYKAVNGKGFYKMKQADSSLLWWQPENAKISSDGSMGFTTGPWIFKKNRKDSAVLAYGHYFTIWQKQANNEFKIAIDLGVSHDKVMIDPDLKTKVLSGIKSSSGKTKLTNEVVLQSLEKNFIQAYDQDHSKAYAAYVDKQSILYRPGEFPFERLVQLNNYIRKNEEGIIFEQEKTALCTSGDLGYVYGNVQVTNRVNNELKTMNGNYLHVWQKNKRGKWKLVAEVVSL